MKKIFFYLLAAFLIFALVGCDVDLKDPEQEDGREADENGENNDGADARVPFQAFYVPNSLSKTEYHPGDLFDCSGAQIKILYDNDTVETIAVTQDMVGEVRFNELGAVTVYIRCSIGGVPFEITVSVNVSDPLLAAKEAAVAKIQANELAVANASDGRVAEMLVDYEAKIRAADTKDAIDAWVLAFETEIEAYFTAKAQAFADIAAVDYSVLTEQFKERAASAFAKANADVAAARTSDEMAQIVLAYREEIAALIEEQDFYTYKEAAVAKIQANELAVANASDGRVAEMLVDYEAKIRAADTKDAIDAWVLAFETEIEAYFTAKAQAFADIAAVDYSVLTEQFKERADSAFAKANADVAAARTSDEMAQIVLAYREEIAALIEEQESHISSLINEKIRLLIKIEDYIERITFLKSEIESYMDAPCKEEYIAGLESALKDLAYWQDYVLLALDLNGIEDEIDKIYQENARTPLDDLYDALKDALFGGAEDGITVLPGAYIREESTGELICTSMTAEDAIWELLFFVEVEYSECVAIFGEAFAERQFTAYYPLGAKETVNLSSYINVLSEVYNSLLEMQLDAVNVIQAIDALTRAQSTDRDIALTDAWAKLKEWGEKHQIFSLQLDITDVLNNLVFDKRYAGIFRITDADTFLEYELDEYVFTKDYMVKYFVPNYDILVMVTLEEEIKIVEQLVRDIPEYIIYDVREDVDSHAAIQAAKYARNDFICRYGMKIYDMFALVDGTDELQYKIKWAEKEYEELTNMANEINERWIPSLPADVSEIVIDDYEGQNPILKYAYDAYIEFAKRNDDADGNLYTDVITEEVHLLECIDKYIELVYTEEKCVLAPAKIRAHADARLQSIEADEEELRLAISNLADELIGELSEVTYDFGALPNEPINKFNRIAVLDANLSKILEEFLCDAARQINELSIPE